MRESTRVGRSDQYRSPSWLERGIARLRAGRNAPAPAALRRLHEAILDRWPGDHLVSVLPGGERVRRSARYRFMSWNPEEYGAFRAVTTPTATVLDVGANVGAYTILFALWASEGRVVAFEPSPDARAGLQRHVRLNGTGDRVAIEPLALAAETGTATFRLHAFTGMDALDERGGEGCIEVRTTTLDEYCAANDLRPDVIKIDVEGAELAVLRGARRTLASGAAAVFVEFHPAAWAATGLSAGDMRRELAAQRLSAVPLHPGLDVWQTEGICARLVRT